MKVKVVNNSSNELPKYAHEPVNGLVQDSGMDIYADFSKLNEKFMWDCSPSYNEDGSIKSITIHSLGRVLIPTGIHAAAPNGYELQVRDRSGYALKKGIMLSNGIGTIDAKIKFNIF